MQIGGVVLRDPVLRETVHALSDVGGVITAVGAVDGLSQSYVR